MRRRLLALIAVPLCLGILTAAAQTTLGFEPGTTGGGCSDPLMASSPECLGAAANLGTAGQQSTGTGTEGIYGQQGYGYGTYGTGGYGGYGGGFGTPGLTSSNGLPMNINGRVPTYVDQIPYGYGLNGAVRLPYSPYPARTVIQPPTEFQRVVAGATGAKLPIFGANLFLDFSTPFSPIDRTPVTPDYVIGPGDQLLIRAWGQVNLNAHVTVDRSGNIYVPQVGNIEVAGLHFQQLDDYLKKQFGRVFRNFDLSVDMGQLRSIQVYVVGNAQRPGSYTVSSLSTLVNALFSSGGPSREGSMRRIELKRGGKIVTTLDLYNLLIHGDKSQDAPLLPGDVIYIPPIGPQIAVAGSVHIPAIYELNGPETAGEAITMAGGLGTMASREDAQLDRTSSNGGRQTIQLPLDADGMKTPLRDGDILRIPAMVQRFEDTVTLRGNVANPGRYRWKPGMRIADLIPDQASLETRGYWERRIALGLPAPEYTPLTKPYNAQLPSEEQAETNGEPSKVYTTGTSLADAEEMEAGTQSRLLPNPQLKTTNNIAGGTTATDSQTESTTAEQETQNPAEQLRYSPPGQRFSQGQFPIRNEILRTTPSIDWSYAVVERTNPQDLTTSLIPFNLGQAVLQHEASQNIELEPGDVITVFSTADIHVPQAQQVKYVRLEGEVVHAGIYSVQPGETLRDVVRRAGGLTPNAYLYGSEFLRESTQRLQQAKLNAYVNSLERDMQLASSNATGSLVNATGAAALNSSNQSRRDLITTLRKMRATGRIVLNLTPYSQGLDALPNLPLQDGDQFIVPSMPATVNVVGAVYDQNTFLYRRGNHIGDYLKIAGGGTRNADKKHEFVIRADGSVVSKETAGSSAFGGGLNAQLAYPGDTVVVPDNINKTTLLRGLTDWSTVLSQFGLGIAALTVLGL